MMYALWNKVVNDWHLDADDVGNDIVSVYPSESDLLGMPFDDKYFEIREVEMPDSEAEMAFLCGDTTIMENIANAKKDEVITGNSCITYNPTTGESSHEVDKNKYLVLEVLDNNKIKVKRV